MICLDFDGVIANYGNHTTELRFNEALLALLPLPPQPVVIVTNQGGMALRVLSPARVSMRLLAGTRWLESFGYHVTLILASAYHPRALTTR